MLSRKHFVTVFSRGELGHGQVEPYQTVQHKNIQSWEGIVLDKSQSRESCFQNKKVMSCRNCFIGQKAFHGDSNFATVPTTPQQPGRASAMASWKACPVPNRRNPPPLTALESKGNQDGLTFSRTTRGQYESTLQPAGSARPPVTMLGWVPVA